MQIEPLSLFHQKKLEEKFRQLNLPFSEYSFANLYLFRRLHRYEVIHLEEEFFIRGVTRDNISFIMPSSHPAQLSFSLLQQAVGLAEIIYPVPEIWFNLLDKWIVKTSFNEDENDYLYSTTKLKNYSGRHLDGKRYLVKHLLSQNEVRIEPLSQQLHDAQQILDDWQSEHGNSSTDYPSCYDAIYNLELLHLQGFIVYVNQKPAGFLIGEQMNQDYYAVHFSKALGSIKGVTQYLYQELARSVKKLCSWINLEQDLGILALRAAKLSYQPDIIAKKWRLHLKMQSQGVSDTP